MTSAAFSLRKKEDNIRQIARANENLQSNLQKLTDENTQLRQELDQTRSEMRGKRLEQTKNNIKSFFGKLRHSFSQII